VKDWLQQALSFGTLKNGMAVLRWWAEKVDTQNVVARSNDHYGIPGNLSLVPASLAGERARSLAIVVDRWTGNHSMSLI
jgi:hypothetical protein